MLLLLSPHFIEGLQKVVAGIMNKVAVLTKLNPWDSMEGKFIP